MHVTKHSQTGKLKGFQSINTDTTTNAFCIKNAELGNGICKYCYARRLLKFRKTTQQALARNSIELSQRLLTKREIVQIKLEGDYIRFHSFGELINKIHFRNFANIAKANPSKNFALWTKRPNLVSRPIPNNLILIFSQSQLNVKKPTIPPMFHKTFAVYTKEYIKEHNIEINCHIDCKDCLLCYEKENYVKVIREKKK